MRTLKFVHLGPTIVTVRNPFLSCSNELPTSSGGIDSIQSSLTRVGMRLMMRIREYVQGSVLKRSVDG